MLQHRCARYRIPGVHRQGASGSQYPRRNHGLLQFAFCLFRYPPDTAARFTLRRGDPTVRQVLKCVHSRGICERSLLRSSRCGGSGNAWHHRSVTALNAVDTLIFSHSAKPLSYSNEIPTNWSDSLERTAVIPRGTTPIYRYVLPRCCKRSRIRQDFQR